MVILLSIFRKRRLPLHEGSGLKYDEVYEVDVLLGFPSYEGSGLKSLLSPVICAVQCLPSYEGSGLKLR